MAGETPRNAMDVGAAALELPAEERAAFLDSACAGDPDLRREVESLLALRTEANGFLETPPLELGAGLSGRETMSVKLPGGGPLDVGTGLPAAEAIPGYRILKELHRGGQGVVYQAVQESTKRKVALKVMLEGPFAGPHSKRRFEREIALIGSLRHPNIIPIFDSGTARGHYYYAMEYVRGEPLAGYVHTRKLSVDDTLRLFKKVCEAVDYAHQRGVIHRDLKPSNILVDSRGEPHVLDFGLAKIGGAEVDGEAASLLVSVTGQVMGTLAYMSPEQAAGRPDEVDLRSDVYALGVILYELLTGEFPYDVTGSMAETLRTIQETEPRRPRSIRRQVNDEIETIVLKALSKQKERRYPTAGAFGHDVARYLAGEPIEAKRDSALYVLTKTLRRYKAPVTVAAAFVLMIVLSSGVAWMLYGHAEAARQAATDEAQRFRRLLYVSDMDAAAQVWEDANLGQLRDLLKRHVPVRGEDDLRGFEWYYWLRLGRRGFLAPKLVHGGSIWSVEFSPDGSTLASAGTDNMVSLWDVESRTLINTLKGHKGRVPSVAFSPDGKKVASASFDGTIKLWDARTGDIHTELKANFRIWSIAFSPDGKTLASGGEDGTVKLWDIDSRQDRPAPAEHTNVVTSVAFSLDGNVLASGSFDGLVKVSELGSEAPPKTLEGHDLWVWDVAFSPDGRTLASASSDRTVKLWDVGASDLLGSLNGHVLGVDTLAFSADGKTLASGSLDNTIRLWDMQSHQVRDVIKGHSASVKDLTNSPDGRTLASASFDGTIKLWLWDATAPGALKAWDAHSSWVDSLAFSPDHRTLVSVSRDGTAKLWDVRTGRVIHVFPDSRAVFSSQPGGQELAQTQQPDRGAVAAFSPDGVTLARACDDVLTLYDTITGKELNTVMSRSGVIRSVAFRPHAMMVASCDDNNKVTLWDGETRTQFATLRDHTESFPVGGVAFSSNSKLVATGSRDDTVKLWDAATGTLLSDLGGHSDDVRSVAFSRDNELVASGGADAIVKVWHVPTGALLHELKGHQSWINRVTFSPDGETLASSSFDGTIRFWKTGSGEQRAILRWPSTSIISLAFSADGLTLAAGSSDGKVRLWRAASEEEVQAAGAWWK